MVCLQDQLPLLKFGNQEAVTYEARWLSDEITKAARRAGHADWFFAGDITRAVIEYLRHRFPRNTITIEELYGKIERVLAFLGCDDIAQTLEIAPPPVRISLAEIALDAGDGYELEFFRLLGERIAESESSGTTQILCDGLRSAVKRISSAGRWNRECENLANEIAEFLASELARRRAGGELGLILK